MKQLIITLITLGFVSAVAASYADVFVNGYYRQNGTYVNSYYRTNPDGQCYNNYSGC